MIRIFPINRWLEPLLATVVVSGVAYAMVHLFARGYLPQPFFYDPWDMWMDWFNVADWSFDRGAYDTFSTIYPPLSYVFFHTISLPHCYVGGSGSGLTSYYARDCDWLGAVWLHAFYILCVVLVAVTYRRIDPKTAVPRSVAVAMGLPLVIALERGQIMVVAFACVILAFGPLLRSARLRWLALGLAINFKFYLLCILAPQLLRRRWRWFEGAAVATVLIYLVTFVLWGQGTLSEIVRNASNFQQVASNPLDVWLASTYNPFFFLVEDPSYQAISRLGSRIVETVTLFVAVCLRSTQVAIVFAAFAAWVRPEAVSMNRLTLLGLSMSMITIDSQYYAICVFTFFLFMEKWRSWPIKTAIVIGYLISFPLDYPIDRLPEMVLDTFVYRRTEIVTYYVMLGPLLRPGLLIIAAFLLAWATVSDVWADIRTQGWRTRWRYRRDLPIMVGEGAAIPPRPAPALGSPAS